MIDNVAVGFSARFGGVPQEVYVPMRAIMGLYARENGQGLFFDAGEYPAELNDEMPTNTQLVDNPAPVKKSSLRLLD